MKYLSLIFLVLASTAFSQVNVLRPIPVINAAAVASTVTGTPVHVIYLENVGIQYVWTGTPTCTIGVQVSNQTIPGSNPPAPVANSFTPLTLTGLSNPSGSAGSFWLDINHTGAEWIEATYTSCSGSGTLSAYLSAKGL